MLILTSDEVRAALPMPAAIEAMKSAYAALSAGQAEVPLRTNLPVEPQNASALFMPAFVPGPESDSLAVKVVTLFPNNPDQNLPFIHAAVLVMDAKTGQMVALLEGGSLTAIRTGAASGAATDLLAREDARIGAIFGAGVQARTQLEAICAVRPLETVRIYDPSADRARQMQSDMQPRVDAHLSIADSPTEALQGVDIVCTATTSRTPVFDDADLPAGAHVNGIGSYLPEMIEIPPETLGRALVTVDSRSASGAEAGELIRALSDGLVREEEIFEIGEIVSGASAGRTAEDQVTYFKSVGVAVQDAAAAQLALRMARESGLGVEVNW